MPELPEVETICRGLRPILVDRRIARVEQRRDDLRWPLPPGFAKDLTGHRIAAIERRGKYILVRLDGGLVWMVHLGMSGRLYRATASPNGPHDHIVVHMSDGGVLRFNDARRFGMMDLVPAAALDAHWLLAPLGPDPLAPTLESGWLAPRLAGKRTPIKAALLDQRVVAGVGNIYACEALFHAGLSPRRQAFTVQGMRAVRLGDALRAVLNDAIEAGGSSLRDYVQADGELGYFQHRFAVYDREGAACPGCDCAAGVRRIVQSGRSTFYCAKRQR